MEGRERRRTERRRRRRPNSAPFSPGVPEGNTKGQRSVGQRATEQEEDL